MEKHIKQVEEEFSDYAYKNINAIINSPEKIKEALGYIETGHYAEAETFIFYVIDAFYDEAMEGFYLKTMSEEEKEEILDGEFWENRSIDLAIKSIYHYCRDNK